MLPGSCLSLAFPKKLHKFEKEDGGILGTIQYIISDIEEMSFELFPRVVYTQKC